MVEDAEGAGWEVMSRDGGAEGSGSGRLASFGGEGAREEPSDSGVGGSVGDGEAGRGVEVVVEMRVSLPNS